MDELTWDDKMLLFLYMQHQRRAVRGVPGYSKDNAPKVEQRLLQIPDARKKYIQLEMSRNIKELKGMEKNDERAPEISHKSLMSYYKQ